RGRTGWGERSSARGGRVESIRAVPASGRGLLRQRRDPVDEGRPVIAVIETGVANVASIVNAFLRLGVRVTLTRDPELVRRAARVVLPGVGAFGTAATELRARGLDSAVRERCADGTPLLAVCLGMQLLCDGSEETPGVPGLGIVPGICERLPAGVRVPHL